MRAVIDTNVLLSALLWHGTPHALLEHLHGERLSLISSPALLNELATVLARPKFDAILRTSNMARSQLLADVLQLAESIDPPPLAQPVCRDPDDDAVLALAVAAQADLVVTGDEDLLILGSYAGIPIVSAAQALQRLLQTP